MDEWQRHDRWDAGITLDVILVMMITGVDHIVGQVTTWSLGMHLLTGDV
jgi:hypothetical protein